MSDLNIHKVIRALEGDTGALPDDKSRQFVLEMAQRLDREGDLFSCTRKQVWYLRSLFAQTSKLKHPPKSRLEELRDRKSKILNGQHKHRVLVNKAAGRVIHGGELVLRDVQESPVTAKMRHDKSLRRQLNAAPSLATGTKRS